jgi:hypothetical protein
MAQYSAVGNGAYVWHVTTSHGTVIVGDAIKRGPREWVAIVTHDDQTVVRSPQGGRITGHGDTRAIAVSRALSNHLDPQAAWLAMMNH